MNFSFDDLQLDQDTLPFVDGSVIWLENEGLILVGNKQEYKNARTDFRRVQLTRRGEEFLSQSSNKIGKSLGQFLSETFKEVAKDGIKKALAEAGLYVVTAYFTWKSTTP